MGCDGIPDVVIGRSRIEIAAENERLVRGRILIEPTPDPCEPTKLARVERAAHDPPVRRVQADHPDPAADRREHPRLIERIEVLFADRDCCAGGAVADRSIPEVRDDIRRSDLARDRDPVPTALAMMDQLVARHPSPA